MMNPVQFGAITVHKAKVTKPSKKEDEEKVTQSNRLRTETTEMKITLTEEDRELVALDGIQLDSFTLILKQVSDKYYPDHKRQQVLTLEADVKSSGQKAGKLAGEINNPSVLFPLFQKMTKDLTLENEAQLAHTETRDEGQRKKYVTFQNSIYPHVDIDESIPKDVLFFPEALENFKKWMVRP